MLSRNNFVARWCSSVHSQEQSESNNTARLNAHQSRTKPTHHPSTHNRIYVSSGRTWGRSGPPSFGVAQKPVREKIGSPPMNFRPREKHPGTVGAQTPIFPRPWAPTSLWGIRPSPSSNRCNATDCRKSIGTRLRVDGKQRHRQQFQDGDWDRTDPELFRMHNVFCEVSLRVEWGAFLVGMGRVAFDRQLEVLCNA